MKKKEIEEKVQKEKKKNNLENLFSGRTIIIIGIVIFVVYLIYSFINARMEALYINSAGNITNPAIVGNNIKETFNNSIKKGVMLLGGFVVLYYIMINKERPDEILKPEEAEQIAYEEITRRSKDTRYDMDLQSSVVITATRLQERSVDGSVTPVFYNVGFQIKSTTHVYKYLLVRVYCLGKMKGIIKGVCKLGTPYDGENSPDIKTVVPVDYLKIRNARDKLESRYGGKNKW